MNKLTIEELVTIMTVSLRDELTAKVTNDDQFIKIDFGNQSFTLTVKEDYSLTQL